MLFSMAFNTVPDLVSWIIQLDWVISRGEGQGKGERRRGKQGEREKKEIPVIYRDFQGQEIFFSDTSLLSMTLVILILRVVSFFI